MVFAGIVMAAWLALVMWLVIGALADHVRRRIYGQSPRGDEDRWLELDAPSRIGAPSGQTDCVA
jgi:hypothetical protein